MVCAAHWEARTGCQERWGLSVMTTDREFTLIRHFDTDEAEELACLGGSQGTECGLRGRLPRIKTLAVIGLQ